MARSPNLWASRSARLSAYAVLQAYICCSFLFLKDCVLLRLHSVLLSHRWQACHAPALQCYAAFVQFFFHALSFDYAGQFTHCLMQCWAACEVHSSGDSLKCRRAACLLAKHFQACAACSAHVER